MRNIREYTNPRFGYFEDDGSISQITYGDENKVVHDSDDNPLYSIAKLDGLRGRGTVLAFPLTSGNTPIIDKSVINMVENEMNMTTKDGKILLFTQGMYKRINSGQYETPENLMAKNNSRGY